MSAAGDDGVEAAVVVGLVVHGPGAAVRLHQAVLPLHDISVPLLRLLLDVPGVRVFHAVVEGVLGVRLQSMLSLVTSRSRIGSNTNHFNR